MTERLDPVRPFAERRQQRRREEDQQAHSAARPAAETANLPVPVDTPHAAERPDGAGLSGQAAFAAQLLGQPGLKRGLRAPGTVENARSAYLGAEYSGPADRRPPKGLLKKAEI
ncbi:MAG: hypothetical protein ACK4RV_07500 [Caulobacter sp.]